MTDKVFMPFYAVLVAVKRAGKYKTVAFFACVVDKFTKDMLCTSIPWGYGLSIQITTGFNTLKTCMMPALKR